MAQIFMNGTWAAADDGIAGSWENENENENEKNSN